MRSAYVVFGAAAAIATAASGAARAQQSQTDLAKAAQNPVSAMISVPFQNNTFFGIGPHDDTANVLNIQPVIPTTLDDWNIINRVIAPLVYLPDFTSGLDILPQGVARGSEFGLGDINYTAFFSLARPGYINPPLIQVFEELKTHPNIPYKPWGPGLAKVIPSEFR